jgi:hypothetical protein
VTGLDFRQVPDLHGLGAQALRADTKCRDARRVLCRVRFHSRGLAAQQQFINSLAAVLAEFDHAILTFGNEPYQNMDNPEAITPPRRWGC